MGLSPKTDVNLIDDGSENKKTKTHEKILQKKPELKFESYNRKRVEVTQFENRVNYLGKTKLAEIVLNKIRKKL